MRVTILGGHGFVGSHIASHLRDGGYEIILPNHKQIADLDGELGHVIYAIGLTGDFRQRLYDTIDAHVTLLSKLLRSTNFDSFLYLSSTRVYGGLGENGVGREDEPVPVQPSMDALYDLSKLLGESLCLAHPNPAVRVARLSNIYGPRQSAATFLGAVIGELQKAGQVRIDEDSASSKDYLSVFDAAAMLTRIALGGSWRLYNVASGQPVTHYEIAKVLTGVTQKPVTFASAAPRRVFPRIDISRLRDEFGIQPRSLLDDLPDMIGGSSLNEIHNKRASI